MLQGISAIGQGLVGNSIAADTAVASITGLSPGRYKIWGMGRHTLADGLKLTSPTIINIPNGPNQAVEFGPFFLDINSSAIGVGVALRLATGASDTASCIVFAENITDS